MPSAHNASGNECLEVSARCQRLAHPRWLQDEATPWFPAPRLLQSSPHPKKPLLRVSCHLSPRHTALGWSRPSPPCLCRGHELSLPPLTSLATCSMCVAGICRVKALLFRSPFNLDPLFISLLVFFSPSLPSQAPVKQIIEGFSFSLNYLSAQRISFISTDCVINVGQDSSVCYRHNSSAQGHTRESATSQAGIPRCQQTLQGHPSPAKA